LHFSLYVWRNLSRNNLIPEKLNPTLTLTLTLTLMLGLQSPPPEGFNLSPTLERFESPAGVGDSQHLEKLKSGDKVEDYSILSHGGGEKKKVKPPPVYNPQKAPPNPDPLTLTLIITVTTRFGRF